MLDATSPQVEAELASPIPDEIMQALGALTTDQRKEAYEIVASLGRLGLTRAEAAPLIITVSENVGGGGIPGLWQTFYQNHPLIAPVYSITTQTPKVAHEFAVSLAQAGMTKEEAMPFLTRAAKNCGGMVEVLVGRFQDTVDPPKPAVKTAPTGLESWMDAGPSKSSEIAEWMNARFCVSRFGNDFVVFCKEDEILSPIAKSTVADMLIDKTVNIGSKDEPNRKPIFPIWWSSEKREKFAKTVFKPSGRCAPNEFNLWRGWSVEEPPAGVRKEYRQFVDHLYRNICRKDHVKFCYLWCWIAQMIQEPEVKTGTAVVLRGRKGTGKTIVSEVLCSMMENNHAVAATRDDVFGKFNPHLARAILTVMEETFWAGDRQAEGQFKHLITAPTMLCEPKGVDKQKIANYIRFMVLGNAEWMVPATQDERRFSVFDVGEEEMQNTVYFGQVVELMAPPGETYDGMPLRTLFGDLKRTKIPGCIDLRNGLRTPELQDQIDLGENREDAWLKKCVSEGSIEYVNNEDPDSKGTRIPIEWDQTTGLLIRTKWLYESYSKNFDHPMKAKTLPIFGKCLNSAAAKVFVDAPADDDAGKPAYWLKPLADVTAAMGLVQTEASKTYQELLTNPELEPWKAFGEGRGPLPG